MATDPKKIAAARAAFLEGLSFTPAPAPVLSDAARAFVNVITGAPEPAPEGSAARAFQDYLAAERGEAAPAPKAPEVLRRVPSPELSALIDAEVAKRLAALNGEELEDEDEPEVEPSADEKLAALQQQHEALKQTIAASVDRIRGSGK